ncbi:hypothetical protein ABFX02_01G023100 [Erythranthe guttata]
MSTPIEVENLEEPQFEWGKKRGIGGRNKDVQFYDSFAYDGVEYNLHDCVYMHKQGEPPYIGKIVKIWENADKSKKIKVHWFFRPSEISYYLKDTEVLENELFFASGEGNGLVGLANINPLEAISGKCNVVCISTDNRNPQPSSEELQMANYVFYRVFDVRTCTISDQMNDRVGGLEVKFVFNRRQSSTPVDIPRIESNGKDEERNEIACRETPKLAGKNIMQQLNNVKPDENSDYMLGKDDTNQKEGQVNRKSLLGENSSGADVNSSKSRKPTKTTSEDAVELEKAANLTKDLKGLQGQLSNSKSFLSIEKTESSQAKDSAGSEMDTELGVEVSARRERSSPANAASPNETMRPLTIDVSPNEIPKSGSNEDLERYGQATKLVKSSSASTKRPLKTSADFSKEKSNPRDDDCHKDKDTTLGNDSYPIEGGPSKKAKIEASVEKLEDKRNNTLKKLKKKTSQGETRNSSTPTTSHDIKAKSRLGNGDLKKYNDVKVGKLSNDNLPHPKEGDGGIEGKIFEVTRRPNVETNNWMKLPWEARLKSAHDQGRFLLLQNLDPEYTSEEVQDIIGSAFKESCTAKMVRHTAISSPHSGQAFVIFKTREAVDKVLNKLDDECLMLPNQRPLVVSIGVLPKPSEKQTGFVGHLSIDRARRPMQREMKEAVSTPHYSQNNTIEYEMAMDWCLLQSKSDKWWAKIYEQQGKELKRLKAGFKSK